MPAAASVHRNAHRADAVYPTNITTTQHRLLAWHHAAFSSPTIPTLIDALTNNRITLENITTAMFRQFLPTQATYMGHLDQHRQGLNSTHPTPTLPTTPITHPHQIPTPHTINLDTDTLTIISQPITDFTLHSDLTGPFPIQSRQGHKYMLIMYSPAHNYIHIELLYSRSGADYVQAYTSGMKFWNDRNIFPPRLRVDNEISMELRQYFDSLPTKPTVELCPPGNHRTNSSERAGRTWKNHFIATLATCDPTFPLQQFDRLVPQAELTLNLLRRSPVSPTISAWQHLHQKAYDFLAHPIAPPGIKVVSFNNPDDRTTWGPHGIPAFYIGPAQEHYRCHQVYVPSTNRTRVTDTIGWLPAPHIIALPLSMSTFLQDTSTQLQQLLHQSSNQTTLEALANLHAAITAANDIIQPTVILPLLPPPGLLNHQEPELRAPLPPDPPPPPTYNLIDAMPTYEGAPILPTISHPQLQISEGADQEEEELAQPTIHLPPPPPGTGLRSNLIPPTAGKRISRPNPLYANHVLITSPTPPYSLSIVASDAFALDETNKPLTYRTAKTSADKALWEVAEAKEFSKLLNPHPKSKVCTMEFIPWEQKPRERKASYYNPQIKVKQHLDGRLDRRVRGTYGGNITDFDGLRASYTADLQTVKLLLNATVSENAYLAVLDITDFYLGTPLEKKEYMFIAKNQIPESTLTEYGSKIHWRDDKTMVQLNNSLYGLPQAGKVSADKVIHLLSRHGYTQCAHTPCLYTHATNGLYFTLVVDDYLLKYHDKAAAEHLISILEKEYEVKVDWEAQRYLGMKIEHDREQRTIALSMPGYASPQLSSDSISPQTTAQPYPQQPTPLLTMAPPTSLRLLTLPLHSPRSR